MFYNDYSPHKYEEQVNVDRIRAKLQLALTIAIRACYTQGVR